MDVKREHLEFLNVKVSYDVGLQDLLPHQAQPSQGLQAKPRLYQPGTHMSNGLPIPGSEKYDVLERELRFDNDDAFRELVRLPPAEGRQRIKITQTRKFWAGLEKMSQYWDTSEDQYYEVPQEAKRMRMDESSEDANSTQRVSDEAQDSSSSTSDGWERTRMRYKGKRTSTGSLMPEEFREETVRGFVEMIAWAFGCQIAIPSIPPRLAVGTVLFPVRHSFIVGRSPKDRMEARKGHLEGPIMALQCKAETVFRGEEDQIGDGLGEAADLLREVGAMLLLAQQRARQHQTEILPGHGKWWTTRERWGGGPGGEMEPIESVADEPPPKPQPSERGSANERSAKEELPSRKGHQHALPQRRGQSSAARRMNLAERWKVLKPGPSLWDKKVRYLQIGKVKGQDFDDIYMISSLNTHIGILHLRVHPDYLLWLSDSLDTYSYLDAKDQSGNEQVGPRHILHIRRSKWYNLFDIEDRIEALKGIWMIMRWMMRSDDVPEETLGTTQLSSSSTLTLAATV